jgi:O-antigen ligase
LRLKIYSLDNSKNTVDLAESENKILYGSMAIFSIFLFIGIFSEKYLISLIPLSFYFIYKCYQDYKLPYFLFFLVVPFSIEYNFSDVLGTDLPSEQMMWIIFGISICLFLYRFHSIKSPRYINSMTMIIVLHVLWLGIATLNSTFPITSLKVFVSKLWYVLPFYFFSIHALKSSKDVDKIVNYITYTLSAAVVIVLFRQAQIDFSFHDVNFAISPLFRNHVTYACIIVVTMPFIWYGYVWAEGKKKILFAWILVLLTVATYLSYTRAAIIALMACVIIYFIFKFRFIKHALISVTVVTTLGISYLLHDNTYLDYAPDYNKTITHQEFDQLISATVELKDISTMERVYRWVAGIEMIKTKPLLGFGPGTFFKNYKNYTLTSFKTYVSENPDGSTVHCYFLLLFIEQGFFGFLIFVIICFYALILGEKRYHQMANPRDKTIIMAANLCLCIVILINLINDMVETDKAGPFLFLSLAIIAGYKRGQEIEVNKLA